MGKSHKRCPTSLLSELTMGTITSRGGKRQTKGDEEGVLRALLLLWTGRQSRLKPPSRLFSPRLTSSLQPLPPSPSLIKQRLATDSWMAHTRHLHTYSSSPLCICLCIFSLSHATQKRQCTKVMQIGYKRQAVNTAFSRLPDQEDGSLICCTVVATAAADCNNASVRL